MSKKPLRPILPAAIAADSTPIQGGLFRVCRDGRVYRARQDGMYELAPQNATARDKKYLCVSATRDGKQTSFYVHRLVAEAFVINPDGKPHINHKDGNGHNNNADNLEWVTPAENSRHAIENGMCRSKETMGLPCYICGDTTLTTDRICSRCKKAALLAKKQSVAKAARTAHGEVIASTLNMDALSDNKRRIVELRCKGMSYTDIGKEIGCTSEYVRATLTSLSPAKGVPSCQENTLHTACS